MMQLVMMGIVVWNSPWQQTQTSDLSPVRGAAHPTAAQRGRLQGQMTTAQHQNYKNLTRHERPTSEMSSKRFLLMFITGS